MQAGTETGRPLSLRPLMPIATNDDLRCQEKPDMPACLCRGGGSKEFSFVPRGRGRGRGRSRGGGGGRGRGRGRA